MTWDIEFTNEFGDWWDTLDANEQAAVNAYVGMLEIYGPNLDHPYSSRIVTSRHANMRELRVQYHEPYRVFYAFNPARTAILLIGGNKTGDDRWYNKMVPVADRLYDVHLEELKREAD